jgi:transglutaminase-like putative cysteine protease
MRKLLLLLLFAVPAHAAVHADDAAQFEVRHAPAWIDTVTADTRTANGSARSGIDGLLEDHQVHVTGTNVDEYYRRVQRVVTSAGVQSASQLSIDFDPSYQRLVLHAVAIIRDGKRIEEMARDEVRIIEKESDSKDSIYDGQLTALLFLKDVRPGDVIDYSWTLEGSNPLLGGRYADEFDFSAHVPTRLMRHRMLWPANRPIHLSKPAKIEHRGADDVYTWERRDVGSTDAEDSTPDWYEPWESVQVTEYASWNEVARWADVLFHLDDASHTAVTRLANEIREANKGRDAQLVAAIRFVQDDIRYLGIEMGRGSHEPRQPSTVLTQRYGDCKDKAFLLAALLRELGIEAYPALVNTKLRAHLDGYLPSPFLFDHVITQVLDGGRTYWIDGTLADQGGTLATIETPSDERTLIVRPETKALATIVVHNRGKVLVEEVIRTDNQRMTLEVNSTYSGHDADDIRSRMANESLADVAKSHLNRYAADHPRIEALGQPSIADDRLRNVLVLHERYTIHDLWRNGSWTYYPRAVEQHLTHPETLVRSMPLAINYPLDVTERLIIRGDAKARVDENDNILDGPALHYEQHVRHGRDLVITTMLRATKDAVSVAAVPDHLASLNEMRDGLDVTVEPVHSTVAPMAAGTAAVVLMAGLATTIAFRRKKAWK